MGKKLRPTPQFFSFFERGHILAFSVGVLAWSNGSLVMDLGVMDNEAEMSEKVHNFFQ